jgi:hypothetical protein
MKINAEGRTESEKFKTVVKKLLSVSKEELDRRLAADPRGHPKKKPKRRAIKKTTVRGSL